MALPKQEYDALNILAIEFFVLEEVMINAWVGFITVLRPTYFQKIS